MHAGIEKLVAVRSQWAEHFMDHLETLTVKLRQMTESFPDASDVCDDVSETLIRLKTRTAVADDLQAFVLLDLSTLAEQNQRDPATAILNSLDQQFKPHPSLRRWLQEALPTPRCCLIVCPGIRKLDYSRRAQLIELLETMRSQRWDLSHSIVLNDSRRFESDEPLSLVQSKSLVRTWFAPFMVGTRNSDFVGRKLVLEDLRQALTQTGKGALTQRKERSAVPGDSRQALAGLGGIGKTAVAVEYAYRFRAEYDAVFFVRGEQKQTLTEDYKKICTELELPTGQETQTEIDRQGARGAAPQDDTDYINTVRHWLDTHSNWLLIIDNVEKPEDLSIFLPSLERGHILLTSRRQLFADIGVPLPIVLSQLDTQEAEILLWKHRSNERKLEPFAEQQAAAELARALDGLPLALEQASAHMRTGGFSFAEYLNLWRECRVKLLGDEYAKDARHKESLITTFTVTFDWTKKRSQLSDEYKCVPDLLYLMAFLNPDVMPFDLLFECLKGIGEDLSARANADLREAFLKRLLLIPQSDSLIKMDHEKRTCGMHRVFQEFLRGSMKREERRNCARRVILALDRFCSILDIHYGNWNIAVSSQADAYSVATVLMDPHSRNDFDFEEVADLLTKTGHLLTSLGRPQDAAPLLERAEKLRDHNQTLALADTLCYRADALEDCGEHEAAREKYHQALKIRFKLLGKWSKDVGQIYNNLGLSYFNRSDNEQAETYYQKARNTWGHSGDLVLIGSVLHNLALLHQRLDKPDTESLLRQSAEKLETKYPHDEMVAIVWRHLGDHLLSVGKYDEGSQYLSKARRLTEELRKQGKAPDNAE